jgi:hypothetical protein
VGARLLCTVLVTRSGYGLTLGVEALGDQSAQLANGQVGWARFPISVGASRRLFEAPFRMDVGLELLLTPLLITSQGFVGLPSVTTFEPGAAAGARAFLVQGPLNLYAELRFAVWPLAQTVAIPQGPSFTVPVWGVVLCEGVAFDLG